MVIFVLYLLEVNKIFQLCVKNTLSHTSANSQQFNPKKVGQTTTSRLELPPAVVFHERPAKSHWPATSKMAACAIYTVTCRWDRK